MNINKLYWKALYYWIRYLNYNVIYRDKGTMKYGCLIRETIHCCFRKNVTSTRD